MSGPTEQEPKPEPRGTPLSVGEARLVATQIRSSRYADHLYWPWVIDELCDRLEAAEGGRDELRAAVLEHHRQKADDRCLEDDDRLYAAAGLPACDRRVGDPEAMLRNCARFIANRCQGGGPWKSYAELEQENAAKDAELARLRSLLEAEPKVTKFTYTPQDGAEVQVEHWAVRHLCASLWDTFDRSGGENFVTTTVHGHPRGPLEVTIRPARGGRKTAAQRIGELEQDNAALRDRLAFLEETTKALRGPGGVIAALEGAPAESGPDSREGGG